jgi:uncharacterized OsmC-like protein
MVIKITRVAGTKLKAEIDGFELISGQVDEKTPPEGPSPSRIMVASLGLCAGHYATWYLKRHNIQDQGLTVDVDTQDARDPSRVARFNVRLNLKTNLTEEERFGLLTSVRRCYVGNTLQGNPEINYALNMTEL